MARGIIKRLLTSLRETAEGLRDSRESSNALKYRISDAILSLPCGIIPFISFFLKELALLVCGDIARGRWCVFTKDILFPKKRVS